METARSHSVVFIRSVQKYAYHALGAVWIRHDRRGLRQKKNEKGSNKLVVSFVEPFLLSKKALSKENVLKLVQKGGFVFLKRVSMGLTDRRKTAKNLADKRKSHHPIETLP